MFAAACSDRSEHVARIAAPTAPPAASALRAAEASSTTQNTSVHWNEIARALVGSHNTNGPLASRVYALVSVAQFEASIASTDATDGTASPRQQR